MRKLLFAFAATLLISAPMFAAEHPSVQINSKKAEPREMEDTTEKAIVRDYTKAWETMTVALAQNRAAAIPADFIGYAQDELQRRVEEQQKTGLHTRYVDHGHKLQAVFYSQDGSAMQLRDTAQLEIQLLDGDKVIHSDRVTQDYLVLMTPAENRWKVRVLQAVPATD